MTFHHLTFMYLVTLSTQWYTNTTLKGPSYHVAPLSLSRCA